jgi:hypothetical protein
MRDQVCRGLIGKTLESVKCFFPVWLCSLFTAQGYLAEEKSGADDPAYAACKPHTKVSPDIVGLFGTGMDSCWKPCMHGIVFKPPGLG